MKYACHWIATVLLPVLLVSCGGDPSTEKPSGEGTPKVSVTADVEPAQSPTPESTLATLIDLAEAGDWEAYVDDYYGESHKLTDQAKRDQVVARFRDRWSEEVVTTLHAIADVEPTYEQDGMIAVFPVDESRNFKLYKQDDGTWKYHL